MRQRENLTPMPRRQDDTFLSRPIGFPYIPPAPTNAEIVLTSAGPGDRNIPLGAAAGTVSPWRLDFVGCHGFVVPVDNDPLVKYNIRSIFTHRVAPLHAYNYRLIRATNLRKGRLPTALVNIPNERRSSYFLA
jgi:hypothetical protein